MKLKHIPVVPNTRSWLLRYNLRNTVHGYRHGDSPWAAVIVALLPVDDLVWHGDAVGDQMEEELE